MTVLNKTSKVTPTDTPPTPQTNNFFTKGGGVIRQSRCIIIIQTVLGINRLHLLTPGGFVKWLGYIYNLLLICLVVSALLFSANEEEFSGTYSVLKCTTIIEYCLLVFSSILILKKNLQNFYHDIGVFDAMLNIDSNLSATSPIYIGIAWMTSSAIYCICEYVLLRIYIPTLDTSIIAVFWYLTTLAHDSEQIFYVTSIKFILYRLQVLKGHIIKAFSQEDKEAGKLEKLVMNTQLDATAMHRAYERLHKSVEELNTAMSFPVTDLYYCNSSSLI